MVDTQNTSAASFEEFLPAAGEVTMFTTAWCGFCKRLKPQLDQAGITYREVNIEEIPNGASVVESVNDGNRTVPTLLYADGSAQTNPSARQVKEQLNSLS